MLLERSILHDSGGDKYLIRDTNDYQTRFNISRSEVATLITKSQSMKKQFTNACLKRRPETYGDTAYVSLLQVKIVMCKL